MVHLKKCLAAMLVLVAVLASPQQQNSPLAQPGPPQQQAYQPKFKNDAARSESEFIAMAYMRTLLDAQRKYYKRHDKYAPSLYTLVGSGSFTRRMVKTDRGDYTVSFRLETKSSHPGFSLQLTPKQFDSTHRAFWINETGIFHVDGDEPATAESPVLKADRKIE